MPELTEQQRTDIKWAIDSFASRNPDYKIYDDYYRGEQRILGPTASAYTGAMSFLKSFSENLCATVVDICKDRLKLTNFTHDQKVAEQADDNLDTVPVDKTADRITEIWRENRMDELQGEVYLETLKSGDGYCFVWPDKAGFPEIVPNEAALVTVSYSPTKRGQIIKAAKHWKDEADFGRLNLYYPDRVEKFKTNAKLKSGDGTLNASNYAPFEEPIPNPYKRVPVFHFRNNAGVGKFGVSELKAAIPLQNRLNKTIIDGLLVGEDLAFPIRYAVGFETPTDPSTGKPIFDFKPGDWFLTRQKEAQLGQLEGANLDQFKTQADDARAAIARVTRTPMHYFEQQAQPPSGESLKTQEAPLTAKVRDRQVSFGNTWEDLFRFALEVAGMTDVRLEAVWENTQPRDDTAEIDNQGAKVDRLGFSKKQALRELGYSDEEIAAIEKEKSEETQNAGFQEAQQFNAGAV